MNKHFKKISSKHGSIFLLVLVAMTVLFIFGFALTFFSGSEDYAAAMSYENEIAFALAESAVNEFAARVKYYLNDSSSGNYLYARLRAADTDISKDIPIEESDIINLTSFTRKQAAIFGIPFQNDKSSDFDVKATLLLQHIGPVKPTFDEKTIYHIKQDDHEKQGEFKIEANVRYKGHVANVCLNFTIRVVRTFVPPFNYFTFFVRDASALGGSNFNVTRTTGTVYPSNTNLGSGTLRLDNGWHFTHSNFNAIDNADTWEKELALLGEKAVFPPGRVYLGRDMEESQIAQIGAAGSGVNIRASNGYKFLADNQNLKLTSNNKVNALDNSFLNFDVEWMKLSDYSDIMEAQGQSKTNANGSWWNLKDKFESWKSGGSKMQIRIFNLGAGEELTSPLSEDGKPGFINCFSSYSASRQHRIDDMRTQFQVQETTGPEADRINNTWPLMDRSGFYPMGTARPNANSTGFTQIKSDLLSPTLVYGPAWRYYFRATQVKTKSGAELELPYVPEYVLQQLNPALGESKEWNASQARRIFELSRVPPEHINKIVENWGEFPEGLRQYDSYKEFMSNEAAEFMNNGLGNFLLKIKQAHGDRKKYKYDGDLKDFMGFALENDAESYPFAADARNLSSEQLNVIRKSPIQEYYEGPLCYAFPNDVSTFLLDFYFVPRSTEDFFRGRKTVAMGGTSYDRFIIKYITDPSAYMSGEANQMLKLNGILALNDESRLDLNNLYYQGHGVIYSSPMMGGGAVVVNGNLIADGTNIDEFETTYNRDHMLTIIARKVAIDTSMATTSKCYVEANIISLAEPLEIGGNKPCVIKGYVATPRVDLTKDFHNLTSPSQENVIIYNPLNTIWRDTRGNPGLLESMYVAKIVTGGVGKFDWKYERQ